MKIGEKMLVVVDKDGLIVGDGEHRAVGYLGTVKAEAARAMADGMMTAHAPHRVTRVQLVEVEGPATIDSPATNSTANSTEEE